MPRDGEEPLSAHQNDTLEFGLCYVDERWAFFTKKTVHDQCGERWDQYPFESCAGPPRGDPAFIMKIAWEGPFKRPTDGYAPLSVAQINRGVAPWLSHVDSRNHLEVWAGAGVYDFIRTLQMAGGEAYLPARMLVIAPSSPTSWPGKMPLCKEQVDAWRAEHAERIHDNIADHDRHKMTTLARAITIVVTNGKKEK